MTPASQLRLCRAGIIIGVLFCAAAMLDVSIGLIGLFGEAEEDGLSDPEMAGRLAGEFVVSVIVRLWPLPLAMFFLVPSLIWRHRLRRAVRALPQ